MSMRYFIDVGPDCTVTELASGGASRSELVDRNPANPSSNDGSTAYRYLFDLGDNITPVSCVAFFGLSSGMQGGTISIKRSATAPTVAGDWASFDEDEIYIYNSRKFEPFEDCGYDATNDNYYRYWMIQVDPPSGGSGFIGEIALGFLQQPIISFQNGRENITRIPNTSRSTIGGINFSYQNNNADANVFNLSWDAANNLQALAQLKELFKLTKGGLYPFVIIPHDEQRTNSCYYVRSQQQASDVQAFYNQHTYQLQLQEQIAFEEPV